MVLIFEVNILKKEKRRGCCGDRWCVRGSFKLKIIVFFANYKVHLTSSIRDTFKILFRCLLISEHLTH